MSRRRPLDIAVVGMACRFPGATDLAAFWRNILAGHDAIGDVPPGRWDPAVFFDPVSPANDRVPCRRGGYLAEPIPFDPAAHGIMPHAVDGGEPEQFLVLDAARAALLDAGMADGVPDGRKVEVVIGRGNYFNRGNLTRLQHGRIVAQTLAILDALHPDWSEADREAVRSDLKASLPPFGPATIPGQMTNATAGRTANRLDLSGASFVVDAASASSLVALDLAARSLAEGRADLALAGGVYLEADVDFPLVFRQLGALSRSGTCRPFAADADGTLSGEGVGVVVLRRRADAERDGDRIYAVLQGVGIASDGRGPGLAAPSAKGHARAIRRAHRAAGVDPASVGLIEGHGLGVPAADRAELRAINATFPPAPKGRRVLGAVSSMIGHAMPAAGIAGFIKAALALHHRTLPPTLHAATPHPLLDRPDAACSLIDRPRPWVHGDAASPRRAGVNAFGFAGINAHAVLESHPSSDLATAPGAMPDWDSEAFLLAADDRAGLIDRARRLRDWLRQGPDVSPKDLAFTLNASDGIVGPCRLGLVAGSLPDLAERLDGVLIKLADPACRSIRDARGAFFQDRPEGEPPGGLAFCFPGEGSQYPGMLADLCPHFPEVRALFDTSDRIAREAGASSWPSEHLFGATEGEDPALWAAGVAVNVVLSAQWALYQLLRNLGLRPDAVVGHSSGELLALAASGVLAVDRDFERKLGDLGALFGDLETSGRLPQARLVAAATDRAKVDAACEGTPVVVAMDNCPHQVVVAGPPDDVDAVVARLKARGIMAADLPFGRAYHTEGFAPALGPLEAFFDGLDVRRPGVPIYSCASAEKMPDDADAVRRLAVDQWVRPVRFRETVAAMHADGLKTFVDVGARGNLAGFVDDTLRGRQALAVAANLPRRSGLAQLNHLVASLFARGIDLDPAHLYARRRPVRLDLDHPIQTKPTPPSLRVGFPEMRLSEALATRLRSAGRAETPIDGFERIEARNGHHPDASEVAVGWQGFRRQPSPVGESSEGVIGGWAPGSAGAETPATQTSGDDLDHPETADFAAEPSEQEAAMLAFQATMASFLETQQHVMDAYLGQPTAPPRAIEAGPWSGDLLSFDPGREAVSALILDAVGDPVAEHHTLGGRRVSALRPDWRGLPVLPFAVMAEILAQAAARLVPGLALEALEDVRAHRWIRYEDEPILVEIRARVLPDRPDAVAVSLHNRGPARDPRLAETPVFEGVVQFAPARPDAPDAGPFRLDRPRPCRFTAASIYDEQWLFHGPALQAVVGFGPIAPGGIEGTLRKRPLGPLLRDPDRAGGLLTDPIIVDNFTHLLGAWGLDELADDGDVIFPLRVARISLFGPDPAEGDDLSCRIAVTERERHRIGAEADIVRDDGTVWIAIRGWEDWRFHWPGRYRDGFRMPDCTFLGVPLLPNEPNAAPDPSRKNEPNADRPNEPNIAAVWLEPPGDMGRPVWRDVLEHVQLGPDERAAYLALPGPDARRTDRLWGRIAAKEAARRIWARAGHPPVYPADLRIEPNPLGRPILRSRAEPGRDDLPAISIAHTEGVAVAIASDDPGAHLGIDVERIAARSAGFEAVAFSEGERAILARWDGDDRAEWVARFWCAKEATAKATGLGLVDGPSGVEVVAVPADDDGVIRVALRGGLAAACPDLAGMSLVVHTIRRDEYAWAWTRCEGDRA
ncbi:beta-ketoacyl synthase N-terminal-like domain-containing protein [Tundrisphaera sp. TA3]|uniref:beta-ketoacyl synthase N-terminal-like domain-containing protein n=1 Tax=Tundrisphaera sp. TA3 TaxID=3435775 RepID=UPI003EBBED66